MSPARPLTAAALVASAFLSGGAAHAACVGTQNTATACTQGEFVPVYEDCVYVASSTCTPVVVSAPACFYGTVGSNGWQTVWC